MPRMLGAGILAMSIVSAALAEPQIGPRPALPTAEYSDLGDRATETSLEVIEEPAGAENEVFDDRRGGCREMSCGDWHPRGCPGRSFPNWASRQDRFWVQGEYLLWWPEGSHLPPLLTTSPAGTAPGQSGVLGQPGTGVLCGGITENDDATSGGRFTVGYWVTPCRCVGLEASYLFLGTAAMRYQADDSAVPILARPYTDTTRGVQSSLLVAHPDYLAGTISVDATTDFQAAEVLCRQLLFSACDQKLTFLLGYQFARLDDDLVVNQTSRWTVNQGLILAGTVKNLSDEFGITNQFHGGELGLAYEERFGRWSLDWRLKIGLGNTHSRVAIDGQTVTTVPRGQPTPFEGALLAQETNIGRYTHDKFSVIPECGVSLGCDLTCRLRATFGYTFLYWSQVTRAADQVDLGASQLPPEPPTGTRQPHFSFATSGFWAQGMNFGLEYRF